MKNIKQLLLSVIAFASLLSVANGQELVTSNVSLGDINVLAADKQLTYSNGEPVSVIRTGIIKNSKGLVARGPHKFIFTLDADSPYPVILRGEVVAPGESLEFVENVTQLGGRLSIPIYPAQAGVSGEANYTLDVPKLFARACEIGFEEDVADCFKVVYSELLYICPVDNTEYRKDTNDCRGIIQQPSEARCDAPFVLKGGVCVHEYVQPAGKECPEENGWTMDGTTCRYYDSTTISQCPDGYTMHNNLCYMNIPKEEACPTNYVRQENICVKEEIESAQPYCETSGFNIDGSVCRRVLTEEAGYRCDMPGYTVVNGVCEKEESTTISSCQSGYTLYNNKCHRLVAANSSCPTADYVMRNGRCEYFDSKAPSSCQSGYVNRSGECYQLINATQYCSSSQYVMVSGECKKEESTGVSSCPSGYLTSAGGCYRLTNANQYCANSNYTLANGRCEDFDSVNVSSCPSNYTLLNGSCYLLTDANQSCPSGYVNDNDGTCSDFDTQNVSSCPANYLLYQGGCHRITSASLENCPAGYVRDSGRNCVDFDTQNVSSCPSTHVLLNGSCHLVTDITPTCTEGVYDGQGQCVVTETTSISSCPSGYYYEDGACYTQQTSNACAWGYSYLSSTNQCRKYSSHAKRCPIGYRGGNTSYGEDGGQCIQADGYSVDAYCQAVSSNPDSYYTDAYDGCFDPSKPNGDPDRYFDYTDAELQAFFCEPGQVYRENWGWVTCDVKPTLEYEDVAHCNAGYTYAYGYYGWHSDGLVRYAEVCSKVELVPVSSPACPSGFWWNRNSNACISNDASSGVGNCPSGYDFSPTSNLCERETFTSAGTTCDTGFTLINGNQCRKDSPDNSVGACASGFTLNTSNGNCERERFVTVDYLCPSNYILVNTNQCRALSSSNDTGSCQSGFTLNTSNGNCERVRHTNVNYTCSTGYSIYQTNKCRNNVPSYNIGSCPSGFSLNASNGNCERLLTSAVSYSCPSGTQLYNGNQCLAQTQTTSVGSCNSGWTLNTSNGNCERTLVEPILYSCPTGYSPYGSTQCTSNTNTSSAGVCSAPYTLNTSNGQCEEFRTAPISYSCQAGYTRVNTECRRDFAENDIGNCPTSYSLNRSTGICERTLVEDATRTCDTANNYTLVNGTQCQQVTDEPILYSCSEGALVGTSCEITRYEDVILYCGSQQVEVNGALCRTDEADLTQGQCPISFMLNTSTGQCEKIENTSVTYTCPSDPRYTLDSDECKFYEDKEYTTYCPDGGELIQGGALCEKRLQSEAIVECQDSKATPDLENGRCVFTERAPFLQAEFVEE